MITARYFARSTAGNYLLMILKMVAAFFTITVCLHLYGADQFGVYLLCFGLSSTLSFMDFGVNKTLTRYTAEYAENSDTETFSSITALSFTLSILSAVIIALIILLVGIISVFFLHIAVDQRNLALYLFFLSSVNGIIIMLGFFPSGILIGLGQFQRRNKRLVAIPVINLIFLWYMSHSSSISILIFAVATIFFNALSTAIDYYLLYRDAIFAHVRFTFRVYRGMFRNSYTSYSLGVFGLAALSFLGMQADRFIIAALRPVSDVTVYTIITRPYFFLKGLFANSYLVMQPSMVRQYSAGNIDAVHRMITKFTRSSLLILVCCILLADVFFKTGLHLWLHTDAYDKYAIWGMIAMMNICIPACYGLLSRLLNLSEHIYFLLRTSAWLIVINFIVSIILTALFGFQGVILGTSIQMVLEFLLIWIWGSRKIHYNPAGIWEGIFPWVLSGVVLLALAGWYILSAGPGPSVLLPLMFIVMLAIFSLVSVWFVRHDDALAVFRIALQTERSAS